MKHHLIPGDVSSEEVSYEHYVLSGTESRELYVRWRQDIHVRIYKNFPTNEARKSLIVQLVEGQAKAVYDNHMRETSWD